MKPFLIKLYHFIQIETFTKLLSIVVLWFVLLGVMSTLDERKDIYKNEELEAKGIVYMKLQKAEKLGSYLFTDNLGKQYRLGANSTGCLDEKLFYTEVKPADSLTVLTTELEWGQEIPIIYSIQSKDKTYVSIECTRESNKSGILPIITTIGFYLVSFLLAFNAINYLILKTLSLINAKRRN